MIQLVDMVDKPMVDKKVDRSVSVNQFDMPTAFLRLVADPRSDIEPPVLQQWWVRGTDVQLHHMHIALTWPGEWRPVQVQLEEPQA